MKFGSLFSGIGGFDLGLERAGMTCAWQVEIDEYCQRVLQKHWPAVPRFRDVREVGAHNLEPVDLVVGGFPCQDISNAGKRQGIEGERSGLWSEFHRIICELRPRYVLVENVAALLGRGMARVLGDLSEVGYNAEWDCIPASSVGAPHRRNRIFIVAYANGQRQQQSCGAESQEWGRISNKGQAISDTSFDRRGQGRQGRLDSSGSRQSEQTFQDVADTGRGEGEQRCGPDEERRRANEAEQIGMGGCRSSAGDVPLPFQSRLEGHERIFVADSLKGRHNANTAGSGWWATEPDVGRVAHGVPKRMDRLRGLGNAVVPQVAQWIGEQIMRHETGDNHADK